MSIPVLSDNSVIRDMQFRIENVRAKPCFCETNNRWSIGQTEANKLVKLRYNTSAIKVHYWCAVWASTQHLACWPYWSKKDSEIEFGFEWSSTCITESTNSSLSENLSNDSSFQLVCNCTCFHSLSNIERISSSPLSTVTEILVWRKFWSGGPKFPKLPRKFGPSDYYFQKILPVRAWNNGPSANTSV